MPLKTLIGLIVGNLIWSAHPAMAKIVLRDFTPAEAAWFRYTSALLAYVLVLLYLKIRRPLTAPHFWIRAQSSRDLWLTIALGLLAFCVGPLLQMTGLSSSRATDNALIVAMEPLMSVFLAWLFLREKLNGPMVAAFGLALAGFSLIAGFSADTFHNGMDPHLFGNLIILLSLSGEAAYSVIGRKLIGRYQPIPIFGTALLVGVIGLTIATTVMGGGFAVNSMSQLTWKSALALLWLGPFGTAASYIYWMMALVNAPVATVALTLFIQPVFGSLWGYSFLGEHLTLLQGFGGVLILLAVLGQLRAADTTA